jgi:AraC family transcriptional regulator, regulatory protein of adaptative response / DNA-3-methyladenine glycosylase II
MDLDPDACYRAFGARDARFDGRVFVGVHTTGIYCRPICPARSAKRENVSFYRSAAAAQAAGFRPCLRCRPELSPDTAAWHGTSHTVARALAIIEGGALDEGSVEDLAARLGVSGRQLRRLFRQHLGASPVAVAQTRRVLLAKQLIHDTDLTMTDVAMAAGFGSVRRFNETFRQLFQRPPASLRRSWDVVAPDAGSVTIHLPYRPPYDWGAIHAFLAAQAIPGVESVGRDSYARTITLDDLVGTVVVEPGNGNTLRATIHVPRLAALPRVIARLRGVFDLAADPERIDAHLAEDQLLAPLIAARPGLRSPGAWDTFELAVRAILGQQITARPAVNIAGRLVEACGVAVEDPVARALGLTHVFPTPRQLAGADVAGLGSIPVAQAIAISSLAATIAADPAILYPYRDLEGAVSQLRALPGIDVATAHSIALRALREPDAFPVGDPGLQRAMSDLCERRMTPSELLAHGERWRPWRAYAAMHLWASLTAPARVVHRKREDERRVA